MKTKTQAAKLMHNLAAVLRGTALSIQLYRTADMTGFAVHAALYGKPLRDGGAPLCTLADLSVDNIPYILAQLSEASQRRIRMTVHVTVRPRRKAVYFIEVPYTSGLRRIGGELATALHESAVRDDDLTVAYSKRTSEVSFCEYTEYWTYSTIDD